MKSILRSSIIFPLFLSSFNVFATPINTEYIASKFQPAGIHLNFEEKSLYLNWPTYENFIEKIEALELGKTNELNVYITGPDSPLSARCFNFFEDQQQNEVAGCAEINGDESIVSFKNTSLYGENTIVHEMAHNFEVLHPEIWPYTGNIMKPKPNRIYEDIPYVDSYFIESDLEILRNSTHPAINEYGDVKVNLIQVLKKPHNRILDVKFMAMHLDRPSYLVEYVGDHYKETMHVNIPHSLKNLTKLIVYSECTDLNDIDENTIVVFWESDTQTAVEQIKTTLNRHDIEVYQCGEDIQS